MNSKQKILFLSIMCFLIVCFAYVKIHKKNYYNNYNNKKINAYNFKISEDKEFFDVLKENNETMLLLWSPRCSHCKKVITFISNHHKYSDLKFKIFTVAINSDIEEVRSFSKFFPIYLDKSMKVFKEYECKYIPTVIALNNKGKVLAVSEGGSDSIKLIEEFIDKNFK